MQVGLGRLYTCTFTAVSVTAVQDLLYIKPAADKPCILEAFYLAAAGGTADAGDAQEELLRLEIIRLPATVTAGTGGSTPTPTPVNPNDAAAGFTTRVNDATTTASTSGTALTHHAEAFNNRVGWQFIPPPEHRLMCANAQAVVVRLNTAPADAILLSGTGYVRELV